jgi:hypothetical protein
LTAAILKCGFMGRLQMINDTLPSRGASAQPL